MTEPTRLLEDSDAPDGVASLIRSLSAPVPPSAAKQAELANQLASLASPATVAAVGTALWVKAAVVLGVLGIAGAWATLHYRAPIAATDAPLSSAAPLAAAPAIEQSPPPVAAPETPAPAAHPAETATAPLGSARKGPARDSLAEEEALLEQARRIAGSSPSQALALLQQYQRRFPTGQLTAERLFLSVDVLSRLGNTKAARKQADALIRAFPSSVYAAQVKAKSSNPGK